ncbi:uncharacterized protein ACA1_174180 [Acanthamoeba castellanii str. Neff]|uniref:Uncharacterized protein n=1 Tax=Acanthamoeba castellanii (strain ATCC 30010 / Neff) TaxID=1257118 RepID=L8HJ85_ACACF|nr:uncharacterized protein ACA1_174180 [Acanthamoeba castellanii str. Neff]ELR24758.1 hypothetical protein ACA1_174180 [Acanthamoeba castellanii str. Neff]
MEAGQEDEGSDLLDFAATFAQLCEDERTVPLGEAGEEVVVRQDTGVGQGGAVWESALALIAWWRHAHAEHPLGQLLPQMSGGGGGSASSVQDSTDGAAAVSTVVELGAGTGVAGLAIGALLGRSRIVLTDLPPYLPLLRHNAALNAPLLRSRGSSVEVASYRWGEAPPLLSTTTAAAAAASSSSSGGGPVGSYDLIVGSDLVYDAAKPGFDWRRNHQELVASFNLLAHPAASQRATTVVLAVERRRESGHFYDAFFGLLRECGWHCDVRPFSIDERTDTLILIIRRAPAASAE